MQPDPEMRFMACNYVRNTPSDSQPLKEISDAKEIDAEMSLEANTQRVAQPLAKRSDAKTERVSQPFDCDRHVVEYDHFQWTEILKDAATTPCDHQSMLSSQMISLQQDTHCSVYWSTWQYPCGRWKTYDDDNAVFLLLEFSAGIVKPWTKHVLKLVDNNSRTYVLLQKEEAEKIYDDPTHWHQSSRMHRNEHTIVMRKADNKIKQSEWYNKN